MWPFGYPLSVEFNGKNYMDKGKNGNKITCIIDSNSFPIYSTVDTGNTHDATIIKTVLSSDTTKKIVTHLIFI